MIYLASGWFTDLQMRRLLFVEDVLRKRNVEHFSPRLNEPDMMEPHSVEWRKTIYANNVNAIIHSDYVLAIYDDEDSGTMWEIGYAAAIGKPIIVVKFDPHTPVNTMIAESAQAIVEAGSLINMNFNNPPYRQYLGPVF